LRTALPASPLQLTCQAAGAQVLLRGARAPAWGRRAWARAAFLPSPAELLEALQGRGPAGGTQVVAAPGLGWAGLAGRLFRLLPVLPTPVLLLVLLLSRLARAARLLLEAGMMAGM
jgi:hypothetical protein